MKTVNKNTFVPVGLPSRWAATSNVEVGQTAYPVTGAG